jgi:hypothetical protein
VSPMYRFSCWTTIDSRVFILHTHPYSILRYTNNRVKKQGPFLSLYGPRHYWLLVLVPLTLLKMCVVPIGLILAAPFFFLRFAIHKRERPVATCITFFLFYCLDGKRGDVGAMSSLTKILFFFFFVVVYLL